MTRQLQVLSAGWEVGVDQPLTVTLNVVSRDLKNQPVHRIPLTRELALKLARELIQSVEHVQEMQNKRRIRL